MISVDKPTQSWKSNLDYHSWGNFRRQLTEYLYYPLFLDLIKILDMDNQIYGLTKFLDVWILESWVGPLAASIVDISKTMNFSLQIPMSLLFPEIHCFWSMHLKD